MSTHFVWSHRKELENLAKHGVSFSRAQYVFSDPQRIIAVDRKHSESEARYFCFGEVDGGILTVRFSWRNGRIRIFGAGYWRRGKRIYEQENKIHR